MSKSTNSTLDAARRWTKRDYFVVPVPFGEKGPKIENWQDLRIALEEIPRYFNGQQNIGVLDGEPYGNCDADLDCPEALATFPLFAPETRIIFGRKSSPRSHYFYRADPPLKSIKFQDPVRKEVLLELRCLKKDGSVGLQTLVPPSVHPSGEVIEFACDGEPANVDADVLRQAACRAAAAALAARHFPPPRGGRNTAFLALAGILAREGWPEADAKQFAHAVYHCLWREAPDLAAADREVESTYRRFREGHEVTGYGRLQELVERRALRAAMRWLNLVVEKPASIQVDPSALDPDMDLRILNSATIFGGRIRFAGVRQRGPMYIAGTETGAEIMWDSIKDVMSFHASQSAIAAATNVVISSPPRNSIAAVWEPIAERFLRLASKDNVVTEPGLVEEFRNLIPMVWQRAGCWVADSREGLIEILRECATYRRDSQGEPPRCAVWRYENSCFLHLPTLLRFLSTASANNKHFPAPDAQKALLLLGFRYVKDLHRSFQGITVKASVWVGPIDLLREDPADPADGVMT